MLVNLLMLAQESTVFTLRNGILVLVLIGVLVGYKMYKNKTMG
jgi:hypothetical protein